MPTAPTTAAPDRVKIRTATATPAHTATVAPVAPVQAAEPILPPLDDAVARLAQNRTSGAAAALRVYRDLAFSLADGKHLTEPQTEALAHSLQVLGLLPHVFRADVEAIRANRAQLAHAKEVQAVYSDLEPHEREWNAEIETMQRRTREIAGLRARLIATRSQMSLHEAAAYQLAADAPRVMGDFAAAVQAATAPPVQATGPTIIRNVRVDDAPVNAVAVPALMRAG